MKKKRAHLNHAVDFALEMLEPRILLSASLSTHGGVGTLLVEGSNHSDVIILSLDAGNTNLIDVSINNHVRQFDKSAVQAIFIQGHAGNDTISIDEVNGVLPVGVKISGGTGVDNITGSSLNDTISGSDGNDYINGGGGDDLIYGRQGNDIIWGDAGNDTITGDAGHDELYGGDDNDSITGGAGADVINSGAGTNITEGGSGENHVDDTYSEGLSVPLKSESGAETTANNASPVGGLSPEQVRHAYDYGELSDSSFTNRGQGQAVAVVIWGDDPTAETDLGVFSTQYGLTAPTTSNFEVVYAGGTKPATDDDAATEASLDLQWIHAIAPDAKLYLVEAATNSPSDVLQAIQVASTKLVTDFGGGVVNMSFGFGDDYEGVASDWEAVFNNSAFRSVTYVASAGDVGGIASYPSTSGRVLSVGGTNLPVDADGNLTGTESAWSDGGGGYSATISTPTYQTGLSVGGTPIGDFRSTPDVSAVGDPATGESVYTSFVSPLDLDSGWHSIGGTSASAPQWSGLLALANQQRQANSLNLIGDGAVAKIYGLALTNQTAYFNDITTGNNGFAATTGYDQATGWGTPKALSLIAALGDSTGFATGTAKFDWNAEYREPVSLYPGGTDSPLFADFKGSGSASIGISATTLVFSIEQEYNGSLLDITATGLVTSQGQISGTGTVIVDGPFSGGIFTIEITGSVWQDASGKFNAKGSFKALNPLTGTDPIRGIDAEFFGRFSST